MPDAEREQLRREATLAVLAMAAATVIGLSGGRGVYVIAAIAVACVAWRIGFEDGVRSTLRANDQDWRCEDPNCPYAGHEHEHSTELPPRPFVRRH